MKIKQKLISSVLALGLVASSMFTSNADTKQQLNENTKVNAQEVSTRKDDISGHWAESTIRNFISKGYINGYSDGTFRPNNSITRAEFVVIFNSYFGLSKSSGKVFSDTKTHWAKTAIDIAVTNGVCNGVTSTQFKPNDPITREQAAVMISGYRDIAIKSYPDVYWDLEDRYNIAEWAEQGVKGVLEEDYMGGYSDNTFRPKGKITRAETVATLSRISNKNARVDRVIVDNSFVKITLHKKGKEQYGNYTISATIQNKSGRTLRVRPRNVFMNSREIYASFDSNEILPYKTINTDLEFSNSDNIIESFNKFLNYGVYGNMEVYDSNSYEDLSKTYFEIK